MVTSAPECFLKSFEAILGDPKKLMERDSSSQAEERIKALLVSRNKNRYKNFIYLFNKHSAQGMLVSEDLMVTATTYSLCFHGAQSQEL